MKDYKIYNERMQTAIQEKAFFLKEVDSEILNNLKLIIDYGCADGSLTNFISDNLPRAKVIGYDIDSNQIKTASEKFSNNKNIRFTDSKEILNASICFEKGQKALVLSSVLHEIYNYCTAIEIFMFWNFVYSNDFDYIFIRDMMLPGKILYCKEITNVEDADKIYLSKKISYEQILSFTKKYGTLRDRKNFLHFLLKYRYVENWDRELSENYFSINFETFLMVKEFLGDNYQFDWIQNFIPEWIKQNIQKDFDIEITDPTHYAIILKRWKYNV